MTTQNTYHIELRAIEPEDIDLLYKWENDQLIWEISNTIAPFSRYVLTKYIESSHLDIYQTRQLRLMIDVVTKNTRQTVGAVDLFDFEPVHNRIGVGILIGDKSDRGKGYADASLKKLMDYTFKVLKLHQVYCNILVSNTVSLNLFKKHGYKVIGQKEQWVKTTDGYVDEVMLQCINPLD
jgi:diamine N-acetyltransferase